MITAKELQQGTLIRYRNEAYIVLDAKYIKPGNGAGYVDTRLQMIKDGRVVKKIFSPSVQLETVEKKDEEAKYLSCSKGVCLFQTDEKDVSAPEKLCGKAIDYLPVGADVVLHYYDGELLEISLPKTVKLSVKDVVKGIAILETGAKTNVPYFIKKGDTILVNTMKGTYLYKIN
ncbi:MAG: hypothetical protein J6E46_01105 [Faecalicoccus sp.]|nr:hypothetical protein [Faecalicoccus sp.]